MIVTDTSALVTLTTADVLKTVVEEFDVHTTETVFEELKETANYNDLHGNASKKIIQNKEDFTIHTVSQDKFQSSRVDEGEGSCAILANNLEANFLVTDDLKALPELQTLSNTNVAISPIVLKALVKRGVLSKEEALQKLDKAAEDRNWLGKPIYRKARKLFRE